MKKADQISSILEFNKNDQVIDHLLENAPMGAAIIDIQGYYISVNRYFSVSLGLCSDEINGMHYTDFTCPMFFNLSVYLFSRITRQEIDSYCLRKQFFNRNLEIFDIKVDVSSCYSEKRNSIVYLALYQTSLPFFNEYFFKNFPDLHKIVSINSFPGIIISNQHGQIIFGSKFASNLLGYSEMEILDYSLADLIKDKDSSAILSSIISKNPGINIKYILDLFTKNKNTVSVQSEIYIDDTNHFKNGRMLIIIFKDEPSLNLFQQKDYRNQIEIELLSEIREFRAHLDHIKNFGSIELRPTSDVNLSDYCLTNREREIFQLLIERKNTKEIAFELELAEITVRKHFTNIYRKCGVSCREDLLLNFYGRSII